MYTKNYPAPMGNNDVTKVYSSSAQVHFPTATLKNQILFIFLYLLIMNSSKPIVSPLRYPGGKSTISTFLCSLFPSFEEYREPFIGGGSVFIETKNNFPYKKYWINDIYNPLYCYWKSIRDNGNEMMGIVKSWKSTITDGKSKFNELVENMDTFDELMKGVAFYFINRTSFSGTSISGGYSDEAFHKRFTDSAIERSDKLIPFMKDVRITNMDFEDVMKENGNNVFMFLDPPYYSAEKSHLYGKNGNTHKGFDHERFANACKQSPHKWLITYDDSEYIRDLFKGFNITTIELVYAMKNTPYSKKNKGNELIITNYDVIGSFQTAELF